MFVGKKDEEIVAMIRDGDDRALEFLLRKYQNFVKAKAKSYFLIGADKEDIYQEGMIGLFKMINWPLLRFLQNYV